MSGTVKMRPPTPEQRAAIQEQLARYPDGVIRHRLSDGREWGCRRGSIACAFTYVRGDEPDITGLEITVFAKDGAVLASQDYG